MCIFLILEKRLTENVMLMGPWERNSQIGFPLCESASELAQLDPHGRPTAPSPAQCSGAWRERQTRVSRVELDNDWQLRRKSFLEILIKSIN